MSDELIATTQEELNQELTADEQRAIAEANFLARQLYEKFYSLVEFYKTFEKLSTTDALAKAEAKPHENYLAHLRTKPLEQFNWFDINAIPENSDQSIAIWQGIKDAAREDVLSGHYVFSKVLQKSPYEHAIYLAVRDAFSEQWNPQNTGEQLLVDQLAQMYCEYLYWLHRLEIRTNIDRDVEDGTVKSKGKWKPAYEYGTTPEWIETTSNMIERFHRLFLRTLRALRDLRRWNVNVNINNPGQVNIGQKQVNTAQVQSEQDRDND